MITPKPLTFKQYRHKYRTPLTVLAARAGVSFHQLYHIERGGCPSLKTAVALEKYTEGEISCSTLLPKDQHNEIEKKKKQYSEEVATCPASPT
jgi:DNA-binding XRE family transcriptional regulator